MMISFTSEGLRYMDTATLENALATVVDADWHTTGSLLRGMLTKEQVDDMRAELDWREGEGGEVAGRGGLVSAAKIEDAPGEEEPNYCRQHDWFDCPWPHH